MFTVEYEDESSIVTVLDDHGGVDDIQIIIDEDYVWFRQINEENDNIDLICMTIGMFEEFLAALDQTKGSYITRRVK